MNRFWDNCKSLQKKGKQGAKNANFRLFWHFWHFLFIFVNFEPKIFSKFHFFFWKFEKLGPKMLILAYCWPKINCMVKMPNPYPSPYCALSSCTILGKNNELQKGQKRGQKMLILGYFLFLTNKYFKI